MTRITDTLNEDLYTFMLISLSILLIMRNTSDKILEKIGTNFMCSLADSYRHFNYEFMYTFRAEDSRRQQVPANIWYPFTKNHECLASENPLLAQTETESTIIKYRNKN
jgi:hypothetical protein